LPVKKTASEISKPVSMPPRGLVSHPPRGPLFRRCFNEVPPRGGFIYG
jgi:hypothetical protein